MFEREMKYNEVWCFGVRTSESNSKRKKVSPLTCISNHPAFTSGISHFCSGRGAGTGDFDRLPTYEKSKFNKPSIKQRKKPDGHLK
mmetsp:Transcript_12597/g.16664  ORF Transcript_12597/g.16664 Transcript_12597/m.16664 type:complete len:86 (+) Transcript_12597:59-316(+)